MTTRRNSSPLSAGARRWPHRGGAACRWAYVGGSRSTLRRQPGRRVLFSPSALKRGSRAADLRRQLQVLGLAHARATPLSAVVRRGHLTGHRRRCSSACGHFVTGSLYQATGRRTVMAVLLLLATGTGVWKRRTGSHELVTALSCRSVAGIAAGNAGAAGEMGVMRSLRSEPRRQRADPSAVARGSKRTAKSPRRAGLFFCTRPAAGFSRSWDCSRGARRRWTSSSAGARRSSRIGVGGAAAARKHSSSARSTRGPPLVDGRHADAGRLRARTPTTSGSVRQCRDRHR